MSWRTSGGIDYLVNLLQSIVEDVLFLPSGGVVGIER